jgi:hypothetical protein
MAENRRKKSSNMVDVHVLVPYVDYKYLHDIAPSPGDFSKLVRAALRAFVEKDKQRKKAAQVAIDDAMKLGI